VTAACDDCDTTAQRRGSWHGYRASCFGCTTRAIARSLAGRQAFASDASRDPEPLREMLHRMFPASQYGAARQSVLDWWRLDHDDREMVT